MMKVDVTQPDVNLGTAYPFKFVTSAAKLDIVVEQYSIQGKIEINGSIMNTGTSYKIKGEINLSKTFICDRCLEEFNLKQKFSFLEEYAKENDEKNVTVDLIFFSGDYIDIEELIRETILLSQPLNNICSSDCRGLCIKCGANLNKADCGCDRHIIDPRLAALQKILN